MRYKPEDEGARCDLCILKDNREGLPVQGEFNDRAFALVIAEAPGKEEVAHGRPLVGSSGLMLMKALAREGVRRSDLSYSNVLCCRPPGNALDRVVNLWRKANKLRKAQDLEPLPSVQDCCWPRLLSEIRGYKDLLLLGSVAVRRVCSTVKSVTDLRGGPITGCFGSEEDGRFYFDPARLVNETDSDYAQRCFDARPEGATTARILPTIHPAFVLRARSMLPAFNVDIARAMRWFRYGLQWKEPKITYHPSPEVLAEFLSRKRQYTSCDIETTMDDPLLCKLLCIGFSDLHEAMVVGIRSVDMTSRFYSDYDLRRVYTVIRNFLMDEKRVKVGHNFNYFDRIVLERIFRCKMSRVSDTIMWHRAAESELSHKLAYVGSMLTDAPAWKSDGIREAPKSDLELHHYNALDCVITAQVLPPLVKKAKSINQDALAKRDHKLQEICVGLHRNGMLIDQRKRGEYDVEYRARAFAAREKLRVLVNNYKFNPGSVSQIKELLYNRWGLPVLQETASGEPSTDDETIRSLMNLYCNEDPKVYDFLSTLRAFRRAGKIRSYLQQCLPMGAGIDSNDDLIVHEGTVDIGVSREGLSDEEVEFREKEALKKIRHDKKGGLVFPDGRLRPHYSAHGTVTRRFSSNTPNAQNFPNKIRDMIIPAPGHVFLYADMDQLELRLIVNLSGAKKYLEVFRAKGDPHTVSALMIYGEKGKVIYENAVKTLGPKNFKKEPTFSGMRDFAKRFVYASAYQAKIPTILNAIRSATDRKTDQLLWPNMSEKIVRESYARWIGENPEIENWWDATANLYYKQGFLCEPIEGWRRDFLDIGDKTNELVNFVPQAAGAALVHRSTVRLCFEEKGLGFEAWGPGTGLVQQGHDALMFEVPEGEASRLVPVITEAMHHAVSGWEVEFFGEGHVYSNWRDERKEEKK